MKPATFVAIAVGAIGGFIAFFGAAILQYMNDAGPGLAPVSGGDRKDD